MENGQIREKKLVPAKRGARRSTKQPLKVVYISNPMKLNTSASNFRSLVQELTGQGAVWPLDPSKLSSSSSSPAYHFDFTHNQTLSLDTSHGNYNIPVASNDMVKDSGGGGGGGAELFTAEPSPDLSAGYSDLYFQPSDQDAFDDDDDRVVLIDGHLLNTVLDDHHDFSSCVQSGSVDSGKKI